MQGSGACDKAGQLPTANEPFSSTNNLLSIVNQNNKLNKTTRSTTAKTLFLTLALKSLFFFQHCLNK